MAYRPGKGSWNNKGSWKPSVRAPRGGQPCKHERHAQFALRSVLHHYDFMAAMYARENGGERFTYIGMSYLLRHCQDIETKQPYSRSMLEKCESFARENRSEEHTSELQSLTNLVCRLLLEKKKKHPEQPKYQSDRTRRTTSRHPLPPYGHRREVAE